MIVGNKMGDEDEIEFGRWLKDGWRQGWIMAGREVE